MSHKHSQYTPSEIHHSHLPHPKLSLFICKHSINHRNFYIDIQAKGVILLTSLSLSITNTVTKFSQFFVNLKYVSILSHFIRSQHHHSGLDSHVFIQLSQLAAVSNLLAPSFLIFPCKSGDSALRTKQKEKNCQNKFIVSFKKYLRERRFMYTLIFFGCKQQKPNQENLSKNEALIHCLYPTIENNFGYLVKISIFHHHLTDGYEDCGLISSSLRRTFIS